MEIYEIMLIIDSNNDYQIYQSTTDMLQKKSIYFKVNIIIFSVHYLRKVTSMHCSRHVEDKAMQLIGHLFQRLIARRCYQ